MVEASRSGEIDGFIAGDPWPAAAIEEGLVEAARWCDDPANHAELSALLARSGYVDQPAAIIERGLRHHGSPGERRVDRGAGLHDLQPRGNRFSTA